MSEQYLKLTDWMPTNPYTMGHRNRTHLRILETVEVGDSITATLPDGSQYTYIVTQVQAFEHSDDLKIPVREGKSIALITCYPFHYSAVRRESIWS